MPRYQYYCKKCDQEVTIDKKIADLDKDESCIICGTELKRVPSLGSFHLKGGGWAKDGYSKGGSDG